MKVSTDGSNFLSIINKLKKINFKPNGIFDDKNIIQLSSNKETLNISVFNGIIGASAILDSTVSSVGICKLYCTNKTDLPLTSMSNEMMNIDCEENSSTINLSNSLSSIQLRNIFDKFDYPEFDLESKKNICKVSVKDLKTAYKAIEKCIKLENINEVSTNVIFNFDFVNKLLKVIGYETFRLGVYEIPITDTFDSNDNLYVSLSSECFNQIFSIFTSTKDIVEIYTMNDINNVPYYFFQSNNIDVFIKDFEYDILKIDNLFSHLQENDKTIIFDSEMLKTSLCKIPSIASVNDNLLIDISIENYDKIKFSVNTKKKKNEESRLITYSVPLMNKINFNFPKITIVSSFLIPFLNVILKTKNKNISLTLYSNEQLVLLKGLNENSNFYNVFTYTLNN